jgi:ubiquinone/menaquinone biosynthesis C-methylase UbiE
MTLATYEPPALEVGLTLSLGLTLFSPYYRRFARELGLHGDERVLDYGAGSGILSRHIAAQLRRRGGRLDCVDISHGWMRVIRKTLWRYDNVSYYLGHISRLDLPDAAYDAAISHFCLHEVSAAERPAVVAALSRKLKPGGRLILREPPEQGMTLGALRQLADHAGLQVTALNKHKIAIGEVYDARLTRERTSL